MPNIAVQAESIVPTEFGDFRIISFADHAGEMMPHLAIVAKDTALDQSVAVRIHSECMTGDVFHSLKCDCKAQLHASLEYINEHHGIVVYLRQEGRGIGLTEKLKAYALQEKGLDTVDANVELGHEIDARNYDDAITILQLLGVHTIRLMTNNPLKIAALEQSPIQLEARIPLVLPQQEHSAGYFATKKKRMGHLFD